MNERADTKYEPVQHFRESFFKCFVCHREARARARFSETFESHIWDPPFEWSAVRLLGKQFSKVIVDGREIPLGGLILIYVCEAHGEIRLAH